MVVALSAGLLLRLAMLPLAPVHGYVWDHDDMVRWGVQAADHGLLTLYDVPAPRHDLRIRRDGQWDTMQRTVDRRFVYPPLLTYTTWAGGMLHKWVSRDRLGNTVTSRAVFGIVSTASDVLLAFGCAALAAALGVAGAGRWAFALALFAPPFWLDSSFWGQVDTVVIAPLVWMVWAMCRGRWITAGLLFGAAAMIKPQAIVLGPLWLLALLTLRPPWRPLLGLASAACTVALVSLPFTLHGGLTWWRITYVANITTEFPATTLKAFNLWYADALVNQTFDVTRRWGGLSMDAWGRALLLVALIAGLTALARRWGRHPAAMVLCAAIAALLSVMLATRVHDRYLLLALPFVIVAATWRRRFGLALVALLIVATAQLTWPWWLRSEPGGWEKIAVAARTQHEQTLASLPPEQRSQVPAFEQRIAPLREGYLAQRARTAPFEWILVALALVGTTGFVAAALRREDPAGGGTRQRVMTSRRTSGSPSPSRRTK